MLLLVMKMVSKHLCQYICFSEVGYVVAGFKKGWKNEVE